MTGGVASDKGPPVGVIGLGLLGSAIARRLAGAGYAVLGHDLDADQAAALAGTRLFCTAAPDEIVRRCERVVVAVLTSEQVAELAEALYAAAPARTLICTTTCEPLASERLAARAHACGWHYVEAPLSGSSAQVLAGKGLGLIAGSADALARAEDLIAVICPRWRRLGAVGDAGRAKLAINLILGLNRVALAEGLVFAERQGLDGAAFLELARDSAAYSQVMDTKGGKMLAREFAAQGRSTQALKDVRLMLSEAQRLGQPLPLLSVHAELLEACVAYGEGALDSSVVIEALRRLGTKRRARC